MRLISADQLALMRRQNEDNLTEVAVLERVRRVRMEGGVYEDEGWEEVTRTPCRMQPVVKSFRTITEELRAGQLDSFGYWLVITAHDFSTPESTTDRFRILSLSEEGEVKWEKLLGIIGSTGPHTVEAMRKFVCRDFQE